MNQTSKKYISLFSFAVFICSTSSYAQEVIYQEEVRQVIRNGIGLGGVLGIVCSWQRNKSILWAILHALLGWAYVIYFVLTRKESER